MRKITFDELVEHFGNQSDIAGILGITPQAVSNWGGLVPAAAAIKLEQASDGKLRAVQMPINLHRVA